MDVSSMGILFGEYFIRHGKLTKRKASIHMPFYMFITGSLLMSAIFSLISSIFADQRDLSGILLTICVLSFMLITSLCVWLSDVLKLSAWLYLPFLVVHLMVILHLAWFLDKLGECPKCTSTSGPHVTIFTGTFIMAYLGYILYVSYLILCAFLYVRWHNSDVPKKSLIDRYFKSVV